jgi:CO/xanthine dehydrogenase Mo-binding subunit
MTKLKQYDWSFELDAPIGTPGPRVDAWAKAAGREIYAADYYARDMLWVGLKRSDAPHARINGIDVSAAAQLPGVAFVLTRADVPGANRTGLVQKDQVILAGSKVRRQGDPIALVAAENRETLQAGLNLVRVDMEELPGVFDPEEALRPGAPVVHDHCPDNLMAEVKITKGEGHAAVDHCPVIVEGDFRLPRQEHAFLETEAGWAYVDGKGRLILTVSSQSPHRDRMELAEALGLDVANIRVITPFLGGGFGGKDGMNVHPYLALAAFHAGGRPVKMWWDRRESFLSGTKRLPGRLVYRLGAEANGRLLALDCRITLDGGAYEHLGGEVLALCTEHAGGPYRIPHVFIHGRCAYTNNPPGGPFRGFGVPQATAGMEQMMDLLARRLDRDPLELRRDNALRRGDEAPSGTVLVHSTGALACLDRLAAHPLWQNRACWKRESGALKRRGVGLALAWHGCGYGPVVADYANAKIELTLDGRFLVDVGVVDMGQGNASTYARLAAEVLNQNMDDIDLILPDTDLTLPSCSSAASRTTYTFGNAVIAAAEKMKQSLFDKAASWAMQARPDEFALLPGRMRHLSTGREMPLTMLANRLSPTERVATAHWRAPSALDRLKIETKSAFGLPHAVFSFSAQAAFVEIDELTGQVTIREYLVVTEAGRILNRQSFDQQIHGGVAQGLGYALYEEFKVDNGRVMTRGFGAYVLPTAADTPDFESQTVEMHETTGPFGMKGVGEVPIDPVLPALANALADACGHRLNDPPFTPEKILNVLSDPVEEEAYEN